MKRILIVVLAVVACAPLAAARSKAPGQRARPAAKAPAARPEPSRERVDIHASFALATPSENWALEDPMPAGGIAFGGKRLSLDERMVNVSTSADGQHQYLFPVSWYAPYQGANPDLKYVVVKYKDGKTASIMAEYLPNRLSLPRADFQAHPDGRSFYSDVAVVRQDGRVYLKQAISNGKDDGKGGLYVDMLVFYVTEDKSASAAANGPR
jgi:hypothetical protein